MRGNISTLNRNGFYQNGGTCGYGAIDQLTYTYTAGTNRLATLADAALTTNNQRSFGFNPGAGGAGYGYDNNGNLKTDTYKGITNVAYNHLNLPNQVVWSGKTIDFLYDAGGTLLRRTVKTGTTTDLVQDYSLGVEYRTAGGNPRRLEAVYHAEGRRFNVNVKSSSTESIRQEYWLRDHLGNTRISFTDKNNDGKIDVTNTSSNEILSEGHYYPFGMASEGPVWVNDTADVDNRYKYNGKEFQSEHGLNWSAYGARYYDPSVGRFMGVDALADEPEQVDKSPYGYAWNNPVNLTDPDGRCPWCIGAIVAAAVDYGFQVAGNLAQGKGLGESLTNIDGTSILISAGAGAASGGLSLLTKAKNIGTLGKSALETTIDVTESVFAQASEGDVTLGKTLTDVAGAKIGGSVKVDAPINTGTLERQADRTARIAKSDPKSSGRAANASSAQGRLNTANNVNSATQLGAQKTVEGAVQNTADGIRTLTNGAGGNTSSIIQTPAMASDNTRVVVPIVQPKIIKS